MNTQIIILEIIGIAILVFLFIELRRKAPAIAQDAAAMERKAMADLHALWLDEIRRGRTIADHATQDAQQARTALGDKLDHMMVAINHEVMPLHVKFGTLASQVEGLSAKVDGMMLTKPMTPFVPSPADSPVSELPDVTKAIDAGTASPEPETPEAEPDAGEEASA